jgi:hypothetical protein
MMGNHQEATTGGMDALACQVKQMMPQRLDRRLLVAGR